MVAPTESPDTGHEQPDDVSTLGRRVRVIVTVTCAVLFLWGTFWGADDDFPFGPFKMYSYTNKPDGTVSSSILKATDVEGRYFKLADSATGLRRAEMEGQMPRFVEDPELLVAVVEAYERRNPDAPQLVRVEIFRRRYQLRDGRPTGDVTETIVAAWERDGTVEPTPEDAG